MAVNRKKPTVEIPAPSASSSEAEDSSSSGEEEQQEQMTRTTPSLKPQQQPDDVVDEDDDEEEESDEPEKAVATVTPSYKNPQSESEVEDDEESDSEDDGKAIKLSSVSDFADKPSANKSPEPATVLTKRAPENGGSSKSNKKAKVVSDGDGKIAGSAVDDSKKSPVSRVWSENDEILLLEGFHAFMTENGSDSITNFSAFYETLKDLDLSLDVTKTRLYDKIRGLKNKYLNHVRREHTYFSKPHEEKLYKISEKIWGGEVGVVEESGSKKSKRNKKAGKKSVEKKDICKMDEADDVDAGSSFPQLVASLETQASTYLPMTAVDPKEFAKNMVLKFEKKKAKELEDEWKEYSLMESQLYAKRLEIMSKQSDVLLDVLKPSNLN